MEASQRPLELILARNLLSSLSAPGFLVDGGGTIAFYNEAAGALLGRRFEEGGPLSAAEWTQLFGPLTEEGERVDWQALALTQALRGNRPAHSSFCIRSTDGKTHRIEASGLPLVGQGGFHGAIVVFWEEPG